MRIELNKPEKIIKRLGLEEDGMATEFFRDKVDAYCDPYIPFAGGSGNHLKNFKTYPNKHSIKYGAPYAHYHFIGKKAIGSSRSAGVKRKISNIDMKYQGGPLRGPHWDTRMMNNRGKEIIKDLQIFVKNGGKK